MATAAVWILGLLLHTVLPFPTQISEDAVDPLAVQQAASVPGLPTPDDVRGSDPRAFESDMLLTPLQRRFLQQSSAGGGRRRRTAIINDGRRYWPQGLIPYALDDSLESYQKSWVEDALQLWQENTCLQFPRFSAALQQSGITDYMLFTNAETDCVTFVGKVVDGGYQNVSIGNCRKGSILHEVGHVLGLVHEQSRPDRDSEVAIQFPNILPDKRQDFQKYPDSAVRLLGLPYDLQSLMHYSATAFSVNGALTVKTHDPHLQMVIGQRAAPSFLDIKMVNELYNCNAHCPDTLRCQNGGYVGPACKCVCPPGLGGPQCDLVVVSKSGCGGILTQKSGGEIRTPGFPNSYPFEEDCYWFLRGPENATITLTFDSFDTDGSAPDCNWCNCDYLEVKVYGFDKAGQRYCGQYVKNPLVYNGSSLMLHLVTDDAFSFNTGFRLQYQFNMQ